MKGEEVHYHREHIRHLVRLGRTVDPETAARWLGEPIACRILVISRAVPSMGRPSAHLPHRTVEVV
jgi:hypothetical protein